MDGPCERGSAAIITALALSFSRRAEGLDTHELLFLPSIEASFRIDIYGHDRKWLRVSAAVVVDEAKYDGERDPEGGTERHEIPKGRKSKDKDQRTADSEQEAFKAPIYAELVHVNAGMPFLCHGATSSTNHPTDACDIQTFLDSLGSVI